MRNGTSVVEATSQRICLNASAAGQSGPANDRSSLTKVQTQARGVDTVHRTNSPVEEQGFEPLVSP